MALHNRKIKERREKVSFLLSRSYSESEISEQLGVDQSTISRDIKVLKAESQHWVYDLAKADLAYYFKQSLTGIEQAKKEAWKIYSDPAVANVRDKLLALKLVVMSEESRFELLSNGPGLMAVKSLEERLSRVEKGNSSSRQQIDT